MAKKKDITVRNDAIVAQAVKEIAFARRYKQGKIRNWQLNENMYYGKKISVLESRANVDLGKMQEFVHTLLAKVVNGLVFKFTKRKESQLKRVKRLNALVAIDRQNDNWDLKFLVGKKQIIIYGREVYNYYADSEDGYQPHLTNVDVYDFLIDPAAGGLDIERALYLGDYGVTLNKEQLKAGAKSGKYIKSAVTSLLEGPGTNTETTQEQNNKQARTNDQNTFGQKDLISTEKYRFWRWFTTYEGKRYYLVMNSLMGSAIRVEELTSIFETSKYFKMGAWPYWTAAAFPDLTEFWTPSYCDYVREVFMAQGVSINQMLDNAEAINKPQKVIDVNAIENLAELKYRRDGIIKSKGGVDVNKAIQFIRPNSIDTPLMVYDKLEAIGEKASGVTAGAKGTEKTDGKVAIYEGNEQASDERFELLNRSESFGVHRFARLYEMGVRAHLTKRVAVDMIGPDGIETEEINKHDIFKGKDDYGTMVEASDAEKQTASREQNGKLAFLNSQTADPIIGPLLNPMKTFELKAKIVGLSQDDVKELTDKSEFGNAELMSECDQDIESLLAGDDIEPNPAANNAYRQKFLNWMTDHLKDMNQKEKTLLAKYFVSLTPIVVRNEARAVNAFAINLLNTGGGQAPAKPGAPVPPPQVTPPNGTVMPAPDLMAPPANPVQ